MTTVEAQGYSKEIALDNAGLDITLDKLKNATQAWKKAGSPMSTKAINEFVGDYLKKHKPAGIYLVVDPASNDTRKRPYSVINEVTKGARKYATVYQVIEGDFTNKPSTVEVETEEGMVETSVDNVTVTEEGIVVGETAKKDDAFKLAKELVEENKRSYVVKLAKKVVEGQEYAGYVGYTPSKSAKLGKFMFFINE